MELLKKSMAFVPLNAMLLVALAIFVFYPFWGCALLLLLCVSNAKELHYAHFVVMAIVLGLYLGLINTTKLIESDQMHYHRAFLMVKEADGFEMYMRLVSEKRFEFFYYFINYIGYYIVGGNYKLFVILLTCLIYVPQFMIVVSFAYKANRSMIIPSLLIIAFFYTTFRTSIHLARQYLSEAIIIYLLLRRNLHWIIRVIGVGLAFSTHTFSAIFVPFVLVPSFKLKSWYIAIFGVLGFLIARLVLVELAALFSGTSISVFNYIGNRLVNQLNDGVETNVVLMTVISVLVTILLAVLLYRMRKQRVTRVYNMVYLIIFMVIVVFNSPHIIQYRIFMALYLFFPYLLMFIVFFHKRKWMNIGYTVLAVFSYFYFHVILNEGVFTYIHLDDFAFWPTVTILNYSL